MRVACVQMNSGADKAANVAAAVALVRRAAAAGARLSCCPRPGPTRTVTPLWRPSPKPSMGRPTPARRPRRRARCLRPGRLHLRDERPVRPVRQRQRALRSARGTDRRLPQDPPLRRGRGGQGLPRIRRPRPGDRLVTADVDGLPSASLSATTCGFPSCSGRSPCTARRSSRCPRPSPRPPVATTGRCCCGPGPSRTPASSWRRPSGGCMATAAVPRTKHDRRSWGTVLAVAPTGWASATPSST